MNKSLDNAAKANTNISKKDNILPPSTPPRAEKPPQSPPPRAEKTPQSPPPRAEKPPQSPLSKNPDQNTYQSPVSSKKNNQQLPSPSPPAATKHEADDFFD